MKINETICAGYFLMTMHYLDLYYVVIRSHDLEDPIGLKVAGSLIQIVADLIRI